MNRIISQANWIDIGVIIGAAGFLWIAMTAKMDSLEAGMDAKTDAIVERMDSNMKIMTVLDPHFNLTPLFAERR